MILVWLFWPLICPCGQTFNAYSCWALRTARKRNTNNSIRHINIRYIFACGHFVPLDRPPNLPNDFWFLLVACQFHHVSNSSWKTLTQFDGRTWCLNLLNLRMSASGGGGLAARMEHFPLGRITCRQIGQRQQFAWKRICIEMSSRF